MNFALQSNAWPFIEARRILERINNKTPEKGFVLFETGYGPSGLPHIGTFGEVARTLIVKRAFEKISDIPTKLIAFSDDMDGLRKVPDNIPNKEMVAQFLGKPLSSIPDPFEEKESYAAYMNNKLCEFLNRFNFEYEFMSATKCYKSGMFDDALMLALEHYDEIINVILPTLGNERRATYSPFLPICEETGKVLQAPVISHNLAKGTITYKREDGKEITIRVTGGNCKMQWKADWATRWCALGVDYEMHGKDLIPSAELSVQLCNIMGSKEPVLFSYELFLDEKGQKISKSKGNGLTIDEWLTYAPTESLSLYMYQSPKKAKRLCFDVIPRQTDNYLKFAEKLKTEDEEKKLNNPVWHIESGNIPNINMYDLSFSLLLNLASACNPEDKTVLWGFIKKYAPNANQEKDQFLDNLAGFAVRYYNDFVKPNKQYREATDIEKKALKLLAKKLAKIDQNASAQDIQEVVYNIGKEFYNDNLKDFFRSMYEVLLGSSQGPRLGSFISLFGINETIQLINKSIS